MAELKKHVTQMIVASDDPCFTGQGRRLTNHLYFVLKLTKIFFTLPIKH